MNIIHPSGNIDFGPIRSRPRLVLVSDRAYVAGVEGREECRAGKVQGPGPRNPLVFSME